MIMKANTNNMRHYFVGHIPMYNVVAYITY